MQVYANDANGACVQPCLHTIFPRVWEIGKGWYVNVLMLVEFARDVAVDSYNYCGYH